MDSLIPVIVCLGFYLAAVPCGILFTAALHFFPLRWTKLNLHLNSVVSMAHATNDNRVEDHDRDHRNQRRKAA